MTSTADENRFSEILVSLKNNTIDNKKMKSGDLYFLFSNGENYEFPYFVTQ